MKSLILFLALALSGQVWSQNRPGGGGNGDIIHPVSSGATDFREISELETNITSSLSRSVKICKVTDGSQKLSNLPEARLIFSTSSLIKNMLGKSNNICPRSVSSCLMENDSDLKGRVKSFLEHPLLDRFLMEQARSDDKELLEANKTFIKSLIAD